MCTRSQSPTLSALMAAGESVAMDVVTRYGQATHQNETTVGHAAQALLSTTANCSREPATSVDAYWRQAIMLLGLGVAILVGVVFGLLIGKWRLCLGTRELPNAGATATLPSRDPKDLYQVPVAMLDLEGAMTSSRPQPPPTTAPGFAVSR